MLQICIQEDIHSLATYLHISVFKYKFYVRQNNTLLL